MRKTTLFMVFLLALLVLSTLTIFVPVAYASPAYENFTTYTEVDPNNHISVASSTHVDWQDYRNEDAYLYKDKGTGHFTDFTHLIDFKRVSGVNKACAYSWMLTNDVDDFKGLYSGGKTAITIEWYIDGAGVRTLGIIEIYAGGWYASSAYGYNLNTWYYLTIQKAGTLLTLNIYSNSARTNLLATRSLTLHGDWSFRYVFVCDTYNDGNAWYGDCDIENLDLQEPWYVTFYFNSGGQFRVNNVIKANETTSSYDDGTVLELVAVPVNESFVFKSFNWTGGSATTNPYNYTVTANMTIWLYFADPPPEKFGPPTTTINWFSKIMLQIHETLTKSFSFLISPILAIAIIMERTFGFTLTLNKIINLQHTISDPTLHFTVNQFKTLIARLSIFGRTDLPAPAFALFGIIVIYLVLPIIAMIGFLYYRKRNK